MEKIVTSGITIGTGGSAGAEGPIVQIGAAVASGVGQLFRVARHQMPILIGCGTAAGISAIFNAPIGGLLFTLEIILLDFSLRTVTPVVIASVIANVTTRAIFEYIQGMSHGGSEYAYAAIFAKPTFIWPGETLLNMGQLFNFLLLGLVCGVVGVSLTRIMYATEKRFSAMQWLGPLRPGIGGALVGIMGVAYIMIFGWLMMNRPKPFSFENYPMPSFYGDGYGVIEVLLGDSFYTGEGMGQILILLGVLCVAKLLATCLTLGSGGSGGVIAPSVFLGAVTGGMLGIVLRSSGWFADVRPEMYALVGMGAVLAAVVHAPLASILILFELTQDYRITLAAMLATVVATGTAQLIFRDSIYTLSLRLRGVRVGTAADLTILRRLTVEQVGLDPAVTVRTEDPFQRVLDLTQAGSATTFVVTDKRGLYMGMIIPEDIKTALLEREAIPLLLCEELMRSDLPLIRNTDDLSSVFDAFSIHDTTHLPVCLTRQSGKIIGLISRSAVMKRYQKALAES